MFGAGVVGVVQGVVAVVVCVVDARPFLDEELGDLEVTGSGHSAKEKDHTSRRRASNSGGVL